jgi:hypothetical protein
METPGQVPIVPNLVAEIHRQWKYARRMAATGVDRGSILTEIYLCNASSGSGSTHGECPPQGSSGGPF